MGPGVGAPQGPPGTPGDLQGPPGTPGPRGQLWGGAGAAPPAPPGPGAPVAPSSPPGPLCPPAMGDPNAPAEPWCPLPQNPNPKPGPGGRCPDVGTRWGQGALGVPVGLVSRCPGDSRAVPRAPRARPSSPRGVPAPRGVLVLVPAAVTAAGQGTPVPAGATPVVFAQVVPTATGWDCAVPARAVPGVTRPPHDVLCSVPIVGTRCGHRAARAGYHPGWVHGAGCLCRAAFPQSRSV